MSSNIIDQERERRTVRLAELLQTEKVSSFIFTTSVNMYYLAGYMEEQRPRFFSLVVPSEGNPFFFAPELNEEQLRETCWIPEIVTWADGEDPLGKLAAILRKKGIGNGKHAIDDVMWSSFLLGLQQIMPQASFISGGNFMKIFRRIKSPYEKETMMHIGAVTDKVMGRAISAVKEGIQEITVAKLIEDTFRELGALPSGNIPVVGSGIYSAQPHYRATEKIIKNGDSVVLDIVGIWEQYRSDMTRTIYVGKPDSEYKRIYDTVRKAQETAMAAVKPGCSCEGIDRIARRIIDQAGYGQYFIHRTGHGIGLETHEEPYIVEGNQLTLEPGMTFSIEPGIYIPGRYGVRIEDCVIVTKNGCEPFTQFPHQLQCV